MIIKKATLKNIDVLLKIEDELFDKNSFALTRRNFLYHLKKRNYLIVAKDKSDVVGYALVLFRKTSKHARIYSIGVLKKYQGRGVAKLLFDKIFLHARKQKKISLSLEVKEDNLQAIKLYEKLGFTCKTTIKSYYPDGANGLKLIKNL